VTAAARGGGQAARVRIRALDGGRWTHEVATLHELYNASFADLWGFVPLSLEEFTQRAESFRPFYQPALTLVAEQDGRSIGFALTLPDINSVLAGMRGRLFPFGWLRLLREVPRIRSARFILMGVRPGFTGMGVAPLLAVRTRDALRAAGIAELEVSLVQGNNDRMRRVVEAFGCERVKTVRLYRKPL
jgi:GNAT superfamily N-acetyltransferase